MHTDPSESDRTADARSVAPNFRRAIASDRARIMTIIARAQARMRAAGSLQWQDGYPSGEIIEEDLARRRGYVLCTDDTPIAYGAIDFEGEPAYERIDGAWTGSGPYAVVHRLAVAEEAVGRGVGTRFMLRAEELARSRGAESLRVDTNFDNAIMLRIVETLGFVRCGEISYRDSPRIAFEKML